MAFATAALLSAAAPARAINPELAATASFILPGVGQMGTGDYVAGGTQLGLAFVLSRQYAILTEDERFIGFDDRVDEEHNLILVNRTTRDADLYGTALLGLSFYSSYGAYRDARRQRNNRGYATPAPEETLGDLAVAPFRWEYLARWSTAVPLLLPLYFAASPPGEERYLYQPDDTITRNELAQGFFVQHGMVAVGEEAFFRGVLNNGLSSGLGDLFGLAASSVLFGLAHQGNPGQATAASATAFGAYLGWLQQRNDYAIGQGVAIHFWWNFLISLGMLAEPGEDRQMTFYAYYGRF